MTTTGLLVRRGLRMRRGLTTALFLLVAMAAGLVSLGVTCLTDYLGNFDRRAAQLAVADATIALSNSRLAHDVADQFRGDDRVETLEIDEVPYLIPAFDYNETSTTTQVLFFSLGDVPELNRTAVVEELVEPVADPIYLPQSWRSGGGYELGDLVVFTAGATEHEYHVQGFVENFYFGTLTMGATGVFVPGGGPVQFSASAGATSVGAIIKLKTRAGADLTDVLGDAEAAIADAIAAGAEQPAFLISVDRSMLKVGLTMGASIYAVFLIVFAALISVVATFVLRYICVNAIEQDLPGIGTMKALGHTSGQVVGSYLLEFGAVTAAAAVVGVAASYLALPLIAEPLSAASGITWAPGFNVPGAVTAFVVLVGVTLLATLLTAGRARRVPPVEALRGGSSTHSFRRNWFGLDRTPGDVTTLLGLKSMFGHRAQTLSIGVAVLLLSFASMFAAAMYENGISDRDHFANLVAGDFEDVLFGVADPADTQALVDAALADPRVDDAFPRVSAVGNVAGQSLALQVADDFGRFRYDNVFEGRHARHANEIVLGGKVAETLGAGVGDVVTASAGQTAAEFLVVGLSSSSRNLGMEAYLVTAGYQALVPDYVPVSVGVYLTEGTDAAQFARDFSVEHDALIEQTYNTAAGISSSMGTFVDIMAMLSVAILVLTGVIVGLVLALMVATLLVRTRRELGVRKAIGTTGPQLLWQTLVAYVPVVAVGALAGIGLGAWLINPALRAALGTIGLMGADFPVSARFAIGLWVGIVALAGFVTWLASLRIRRRPAVELIRG